MRNHKYKDDGVEKLFENGRDAALTIQSPSEIQFDINKLYTEMIR